MGTNYYLKAEPCAHCGRGDTQLHIGKSSAGWPFLLAPNRDLDVDTWKAWRQVLCRPENRDRIIDEYHKPVTFAELVNTVENRVVGDRDGGHDRLDPEGYRFSLSEDFS